jgi:hypothetical protein
MVFKSLIALLILALTGSVNAAAIAARQGNTAGESGNSAEFSNGRKFLLGRISREQFC